MSEFELKPMRAESIPAAVEKAKRYRLLNEPMEAESICRDVLRVDGSHQEALQTLVLALSDQVEQGKLECHKVAEEFLPRIEDEYVRTYHHGLLCERRAKRVFRAQRPRFQFECYEWLRRAMDRYEAAERLSPAGNDDAVLRWNTCARILNKNPQLRPEPEEPPHATMLE